MIGGAVTLPALPRSIVGGSLPPARPPRPPRTSPDVGQQSKQLKEFDTKSEPSKPLPTQMEEDGPWGVGRARARPPLREATDRLLSAKLGTLPRLLLGGRPEAPQPLGAWPVAHTPWPSAPPLPPGDPPPPPPPEPPGGDSEGPAGRRRLPRRQRAAKPTAGMEDPARGPDHRRPPRQPTEVLLWPDPGRGLEVLPGAAPPTGAAVGPLRAALRPPSPLPARAATPVVVCQWEAGDFLPMPASPAGWRPSEAPLVEEGVDHAASAPGWTAVSPGGDPLPTRLAMADVPIAPHLRGQWAHLLTEEGTSRLEVQGAEKVAWAAVVKRAGPAPALPPAAPGRGRPPPTGGGAASPGAAPTPPAAAPAAEQPVGGGPTARPAVRSPSPKRRRGAAPPAAALPPSPGTPRTPGRLPQPSAEAKLALTRLIGKLEAEDWDMRYGVQQEERNAWRLLVREMDTSRVQALCREGRCAPTVTAPVPLASLLHPPGRAGPEGPPLAASPSGPTDAAAADGPLHFSFGGAHSQPEPPPYFFAPAAKAAESGPPPPSAAYPVRVTALPTPAPLPAAASIGGAEAEEDAAELGPSLHSIPPTMDTEAARVRVQLGARLQRLQAALAQPTPLQQVLALEEEEQRCRASVERAEWTSLDTLHGEADAVRQRAAAEAELQAWRAAWLQAEAEAVAAQHADAVGHIQDEEAYERQRLATRFEQQRHELREREAFLEAKLVERDAVRLLLEALQAEDDARAEWERLESNGRRALRALGRLVHAEAQEQAERRAVAAGERDAWQRLQRQLEVQLRDARERRAEAMLEAELRRQEWWTSVSQVLEDAAVQCRHEAEAAEEAARWDVRLQMEHEWEPLHAQAASRSAAEAAAAEERQRREAAAAVRVLWQLKQVADEAEELLGERGRLEAQLLGQAREEVRWVAALAVLQWEECGRRAALAGTEAAARDGERRAEAEALAAGRAAADARQAAWQAAWAPRVAQLDRGRQAEAQRIAVQEQRERAVLWEIMLEQRPRSAAGRLDLATDLAVAAPAPVRSPPPEPTRSPAQPPPREPAVPAVRANAAAPPCLACEGAEALGRRSVEAEQWQRWVALWAGGEAAGRAAVQRAEAAAAAEVFAAAALDRRGAAHRGLAQQVGDLEARIQAAANEELQALVAEQDAARQWLQNLERRARDAVLRSSTLPLPLSF